MPAQEAIDAAIAACLVEQTDPSFEAVRGLGPDGLRRLHDIYYRGVAWAAPDLSGAGREIGDVWGHMLFVLATANPSAYLEQIAARRLKLSTLEVVILSSIDDSRATAVLVECCRERDWLIRLHAVQGLAARDDAVAVAAVDNAAKLDCSIVVRVAAVKGVARRDPARGRAFYTALLEHPHLTPLLRQEIEAAVCR